MFERYSTVIISRAKECRQRFAGESDRKYTICENYADGFAALIEELPNLLIIDVESEAFDPQLYRFMEKIASDIRTFNIPVFLVSNQSDRELKRIYPFVTFDTHIKKPIDPERLDSEIAQLAENGNFYIGSYSNRIIKSLVQYHRTSTTAMKMLALLEGYGVFHPIDANELYDMQSALLALSTVFKTDSPKSLVELCKSMRITPHLIRYIEGAIDPRTHEERIVATIFWIKYQKIVGKKPHFMPDFPRFEEVYAPIEEIVKTNTIVVKSIMSFNLVWERLMDLTAECGDEYADIDRFFMEIKKMLQENVVSHDLLVTQLNAEAGRIVFTLYTVEQEKLTSLVMESKKQVSHAQQAGSAEVSERITVSAHAFIEGLDIDLFNEEMRVFDDLENELVSVFYDSDPVLLQKTFGETGRLYIEYGNKLRANFLEFTELGATITTLGETLISADVGVIPGENVNRLITQLDMLADDLIYWRQNVFVQASAQDIHYLDDSLTTSIAQLESLLLNRVDDVEEELELF